MVNPVLCLTGKGAFCIAAAGETTCSMDRGNGTMLAAITTQEGSETGCAMATVLTTPTAAATGHV